MYVALLLWLGIWGIIPVTFLFFSGYVMISIFNIIPHLKNIGYRHPEQTAILKDNSTNLMPWSVLHLGDDLHQNHHMYPSAPSYRVKWWEFDLGYIYVLVFKYLRLISNVQPTPRSGLARKFVNNLDK
jgi:fatty-acid desaturase